VRARKLLPNRLFEGNRGHFRGQKGPPLTNYASEIIENRSGKQPDLTPPFEFRGGKNVAPDRSLGARRRCKKPLYPGVGARRPAVGPEGDLSPPCLGALLRSGVVRRAARGEVAGVEEESRVAAVRLAVVYDARACGALRRRSRRQRLVITQGKQLPIG
jgi:hypothetical protein